MRVALTVLALLALTVGVASAQLAAPEVTTPVNGDRVGPSIAVQGQADGKQFIVVITDVYVAGKAKPVGSVPGIRHWTNEDGSFAFRVATPRVFNAKDADLTYKVRVFCARPGEKGPETVVTCKPE
jgi:hypothetical protein